MLVILIQEDEDKAASMLHILREKHRQYQIRNIRWIQTDTGKDILIELLRRQNSAFLIVSVNLGSLRQEVSSSGRVLVITDYVELMKERQASLHTKVADLRLF